MCECVRTGVYFRLGLQRVICSVPGAETFQLIPVVGFEVNRAPQNLRFEIESDG